MGKCDNGEDVQMANPVELIKQIQKVIKYRTDRGHDDYIIKNHLRDIEKLQRAVGDIDYLMMVYAGWDLESQDDEG